MRTARAKIFGATWIAAVGGLVYSASALAGTVETNGPWHSTLTFRGGSGEANQVTVTHAMLGWDWRFTVVDASAELQAGPGCVAVTAHEASCDLSSNYGNRVEIYLGDANDSLVAETGCYMTSEFESPCAFYADGGDGDDHLMGPNTTAAVLDGGKGNDVVEGQGGVCVHRGGCWGDSLHGGPGDDILRGGPGNNSLDPGTGADSISGGPGHDSVTYIDRTAAVRVDLNGVAGDGEPGEGDHVRLDVEGAIGGRGDDTLIGNGRPNGLAGRLGNDRIFGRGGYDRLSGYFGADLLLGGRGHDCLELGPGRDRGYGKAGDDYIGPRDRHADLLDGGSGTDRAHLNPRLDRFRRLEKILRGASGHYTTNCRAAAPLLSPDGQLPPSGGRGVALGWSSLE